MCRLKASAYLDSQKDVGTHATAAAAAEATTIHPHTRFWPVDPNGVTVKAYVTWQCNQYARLNINKAKKDR